MPPQQSRPDSARTLASFKKEVVALKQQVAKLTKAVEKIDDFWSYSRHGSDINRTATLLLHYNGLHTAVGGVVAGAAFALPLTQPIPGSRN